MLRPSPTRELRVWTWAPTRSKTVHSCTHSLQCPAAPTSYPTSFPTSYQWCAPERKDVTARKDATTCCWGPISLCHSATLVACLISPLFGHSRDTIGMYSRLRQFGQAGRGLGSRPGIPTGKRRRQRGCYWCWLGRWDVRAEVEMGVGWELVGKGDRMGHPVTAHSCPGKAPVHSYAAVRFEGLSFYGVLYR